MKKKTKDGFYDDGRGFGIMFLKDMSRQLNTIMEDLTDKQLRSIRSVAKSKSYQTSSVGNHKTSLEDIALHILLKRNGTGRKYPVVKSTPKTL